MSRILAPLAALMVLAAMRKHEPDHRRHPDWWRRRPTGGSCKNGIVCSGEVNVFTYNSTTDEVKINNLPFDLDGTYVRNTAFDRNGFQGYVNSSGSKSYVALFSASLASTVSSGVVGTDEYINYGYGGTMYASTGATLPSHGEATFDGNYAGLRTYEGDSTAIGTSDGTIHMQMDFDDFDVVGAIDIIINDRHAYDNSGALIGDLPYLSGTTTQHTGIKINSTTVTEVNPDSSLGGSGTLEGIFGGNIAAGTGEIAGVVVITSPDTASGLNVKERGAFIANQTNYTP